ncbi:MAG: tetratricopeptide repeat protein [Lachnospiraceae bacterium]|nr:tetratricopeptide repeat protein [Lachnospiraceae bacterium]
MICQNCGHEFNIGNICPICQSDCVLLNKARNASLRQYNNGVAAAKNGDYSSAIDSLNQCILFDKRNYVARNLLGIAYYQVGMVSDALKQWIISASFKSEKNPAEKYIASLQNNARTLERYDDAIVMYNKAITQFKSGSADLAVIQLKKAVDFSPNFVEAYNLLAAYFLSHGDRNKAKFYIEKVLKIDKKNPKALEYLAVMSSNETEKGKKTTYKTGYDESTRFGAKLERLVRPELVTFVAGIIITAVVSVVLIAPAIQDGLGKKISELEAQVVKLEEENSNGTSKFAIEYNHLEEENKLLKLENDRYKDAENMRDQKAGLQLAEVYTVAGRYGEAAGIIIKLDMQLFTENEKNKIAEIKAEAYPVAGRHYFESGKKAFDTGDYETAKSLLETAMSYSNKEDFVDDTLFLLGQLSEKKGDYGQAKEYYGRVINEFSNSNLFNQAEAKLNELLAIG